MARNVYQTKNYFIAAYHYVQCYGTDLVVPSSTAEVAQAMAHYHKRAQVRSSRALQQRLAKPSAQVGTLLSLVSVQLSRWCVTRGNVTRQVHVVLHAGVAEAHKWCACAATACS